MGNYFYESQNRREEKSKPKKMFVLGSSAIFLERIASLKKDSVLADLLYRCISEGLPSEYVNGEVREVDISNDDNGISYYSVKDEKLKRLKCKPGKFVNKFFSELYLKQVNISDKDIEIFSNLWQSNAQKNGLEIVFGKEIIESYYEGNYYCEPGREGMQLKGTLWKSCMRHEKNLNYMQLYIDYPESLKLLVLKKRGKVAARALLWTLADGTKFMDRIYSYEDYQVDLFKDWAIQNGYYYKFRQTFNDSRVVNPKTGQVEEFLMEFKLLHHTYRYYPYFDTLKYLNTETGILTNKEFTKIAPIPLLQSTDGSVKYAVYDSWNEKFSKMEECIKMLDGKFIISKDACLIPYLKGYATPDDSVFYKQGRCFILKKDAVFNSVRNEHIYKYDAIFSKFHKTYLHIGEMVRLKDDVVDENWCLFSKTYKTYFLKTDVVFATISSGCDWMPLNECVKINGLYFLEKETKEINGKRYFIKHLDGNSVKPEFKVIYSNEKYAPFKCETDFSLIDEKHETEAVKYRRKYDESVEKTIEKKNPYGLGVPQEMNFIVGRQQPDEPQLLEEDEDEEVVRRDRLNREEEREEERDAERRRHQGKAPRNFLDDLRAMTPGNG